MALANLSATANDCYVGGSFYMMWWLAGDSSMQTGFVIADHATNDAEVIICSTSGIPFGVAALQSTVDVDTAFTDAILYSFYALHSGTVFRLGKDTTAQVIKLGDSMRRSAAVAGLIGGGALDANSHVGKYLETEDVGADKWLKVIT